MNSGILNIYKEKGYTSFDVVAKLRGILKIKKIGHTGTLDPAAEGVLPVCIGKATKVCDLLTDRDKEYEAVMRLGVTTDTQDMTGTVLSRKRPEADEQEIMRAVASFVGEISQIPPMYSALKVNGKKLCDLARQGVEVHREPRKVTVYGIEITKIELPLVFMKVQCSKGTYIRTLCHDIGNLLGCGGAMEALVRTRVADFLLEDSLKLQEIEEAADSGRLSGCLHAVDEIFSHYPRVELKREAGKKMINGGRAGRQDVCSDSVPTPEEGCTVRMYLSDGRFLGIYVWQEGQYHLKKMFLE